jgi:acetylglutamate kinase/predicted GNAT family N-acyltransferase
VYGHYYSQFAGQTFVIQAEDEAVENPDTTRVILQGMDDLLRHGIRVLFVFGKGAQFAAELRGYYGVTAHPETNRLIIPELALPRIEQERAKIIRSIGEICSANAIPYGLIPQSAIRVERRIGHGSTGVTARFELPEIEATLRQRQLTIVGFGGEDEDGDYLHVPSVSLAADLAVALRAQKLLFLMHSDGISVPHPKKGLRQISFADLEELLCLLQRQDDRGRFVLPCELVPKVHASIRAVAGGVRQVHLVSYTRLLDEVLTRTGVGTMIERLQSHHVDHARPEDLDEVERLHVESQQFRSPYGTPYVNPLDRAQLAQLLPQTLLLRHREVIIGKLHTASVSDEAHTIQIGGFVIAENHQDSQHGQLLLTETLACLRERGCVRAVAITASHRASALFRRLGGVCTPAVDSPSPLARKSLLRYAPEERGQVEWIEFLLQAEAS